MSRYVPISIEEMRPLFQKTDSRGRRWEEGVQGKSEIVFDFPLATNCIVRVWTSCHTSTDMAAGSGNDSIKVCAFNPISKRGLVKAARVYRTKNWRDNLKDRVFYVFTEAMERLQNKKFIEGQ